MIDFRWSDDNEEHVAAHGVTPAEAEHVVYNASRPWPMDKGDGKWIVQGRGNGGRMVQVIFVYDDEPHREMVYVIHAMPLTTRRRRMR